METLIILFVLYSLFQWLFGDNKKKQQQKQKQRQQREQAAGAGAESGQPQSWEDAMKELESVFTGNPSPRRQPEPEPAPRQQQQKKAESFAQQSSAQERFSDDPFSDDMTTKRRSYNSGIDTKKLEASGNPIYSREIGGDEKDAIAGDGIDTVQAKDVLEYINDPEAARKAIIMKEILDRPKSLRKSARIW